MTISRRTKRNLTKKRKILYIVLVLSIVLLSGVGVFATSLVLEARQAASKIYVPLEGDKEGSTNIDTIKDVDSAFTILLAGIERKEEEKNGRSDMLLLATVNPHTQKISMVNIPRDTMVDIEEIGRKDKINHAYAHGGMNYTINTLENLLEIPIDYYVSTDFQGFEDIVDTVGGVNVDVPFTVDIQLADTLKWKTYTKGPMLLQGNEALAYVRMRKRDTEGDRGRNTRQKQVIQDIINKATSLSNISKIDNMIKDVGENVQTNIPPSKYLELMKMYQRMKANPIEQLQLIGEDKQMYNELEKKKIWYFFPSEDSLKELKESLKLNLEKVNE